MRRVPRSEPAPPTRSRVARLFFAATATIACGGCQLIFGFEDHHLGAGGAGGGGSGGPERIATLDQPAVDGLARLVVTDTDAYYSAGGPVPAGDPPIQRIALDGSKVAPFPPGSAGSSVLDLQVSAARVYWLLLDGTCSMKSAQSDGSSPLSGELVEDCVGDHYRIAARPADSDVWLVSGHDLIDVTRVDSFVKCAQGLEGLMALGVTKSSARTFAARVEPTTQHLSVSGYEGCDIRGPAADAMGPFGAGQFMAVDDDALYWGDTSGITRLPLDATRQTYASTAAQPIEDVAVDDSFLYFSVAGGGVFYVPKDDATATATRVDAIEGDPSLLRAYGGKLYYIEDGALWRLAAPKP